MYVLVLIREIDLEIAKLSDPCIIFFMSKIDKLYIYAKFSLISS